MTPTQLKAKVKNLAKEKELSPSKEIIKLEENGH